jgi:hypothetical protein
MSLRFTAFVILIAIFLSSCQQQQAPSPVDESAYTQVAETVYAELTHSAPLETLLPLTPAAENTPVPPAVTATNTAPAPSPTVLPTMTPLPTSTPSQPTSAPKLVFQDNFKHQTGWAEQEGDDYGFGFYQGGYRIYDNLLNAAIWSVKELELGDVLVEIDASQLAGPLDGYYGAVCRFQNGSNYYALVVSSNNSFGIAKMKAGKFEFLQQGTAQTGVIQPVNVMNQIRADCVGSSLTLNVNGQKLLEVEDSDFSTGSTGMVAGTRMKPGMVAFFDSIAVYQP